MKPITALCFLLSAIALAGLNSRRDDRHRLRFAARLCAALVVAIGLLIVWEYIGKTDFGIDGLLFPRSMAALRLPYHGRMSAASAIGFCLLGGSLLLLGLRRALYPSQLLALLAAFNGAVALVGTVYGPSALYQMPAYSTTAVHTAALFILLGMASILSCPEFGLASALTSRHIGGLMARRLVPIVSILPVALGWLRWQGELAGHYNTAFGLVIFTLSNVVMLNLLLWLSAFWLNRLDQQRERSVTAELESSGKLRLFIEHAPAALAMFDRDMRYIETSHRWRNDYGLGDRELTGMSHYEVLPEIPEAWKKAHRRALAGEVLRSEGDLFRRADGSEQWVRWEIRPWHEPHRGIGGILIFTEDISDSYRARQQLAGQTSELERQAAELLRSKEAIARQARTLESVLENMNEGLIAADAKGNFMLWNAAADRIIGMSRENVPPSRWSEHFHVYQSDGKTPFPSDELPLARALRGHRAFAEMFLRHPERGPGAWIEVTAAPITNENGAVHAAVAVIRDVTQRVIVDREIRKLNADLEQRVVERTAQLEAANKELETFTYSVSHDLRAPLRQISGFAKILTEDFASTLAPEARRYLSQISQGAQSMTQLIHELLNLSRLDRQSLQRRTVELNALAAEVVAILQHETEGRNVRWRIAPLPLLECDPVLAKQVFQNLVSNALKYSRHREQAVIEIGQVDHEGCAAIFVRDNGAGFDMKYADKLFGAFQRLHRNEEFEGIGIGLATVARIVRKHGGKVWAEAEPNRGATFYFTLTGSESGQSKSLPQAVSAE